MKQLTGLERSGALTQKSKDVLVSLLNDSTATGKTETNLNNLIIGSGDGGGGGGVVKIQDLVRKLNNESEGGGLKLARN